ncbi:hypothetical protein G9A89_000239 [Geosiphon pyriformis]|nr:hypothetical protein G9A89_000239 [Geosiphon pyriformis]
MVGYPVPIWWDWGYGWGLGSWWDIGLLGHIVWGMGGIWEWGRLDATSGVFRMPHGALGHIGNVVWLGYPMGSGAYGWLQWGIWWWDILWHMVGIMGSMPIVAWGYLDATWGRGLPLGNGLPLVAIGMGGDSDRGCVLLM